MCVHIHIISHTIDPLLLFLFHPIYISVGISGTCPICMEECSEVVALPCGHILCRDDYERMGGLVKSLNTQGSNIDDNEDSLLIHIRKAGQHGVNGTYRRHCHLKNKYTSMGRYDGRDVEYYIELRVNDNTKWWFLSCDLGQNPQGGSDIIDFYKAKVNLRFAYPSHITWQAASFQYGTFPAPKVSDSRCEDRVHF